MKISFIENFYYGNIDPQLRKIKENVDFAKDFEELCKKENMLREKLAGEDKELFIEYINLWGLVCSDLEFSSYQQGFKHGAQFSLEAFSEN